MAGWLQVVWQWAQAHPMWTSLIVAVLAALGWYATKESAAEKAGREAFDRLKKQSGDQYRDLRSPGQKDRR